MIRTVYGDEVAIASGKYYNLLDPSTQWDPLVKVQFVKQPKLICEARLSRLVADGGPEEIEAAIKQRREG